MEVTFALLFPGCLFSLRKGSSEAVSLVQVWGLLSSHLNTGAILICFLKRRIQTGPLHDGHGCGIFLGYAPKGKEVLNSCGLLTGPAIWGHGRRPLCSELEKEAPGC